MKIHLIYKLLFLSAFTIMVSAGCTDMNEYTKFLEGGEIEYTGKIDTVAVLAGDGRVAVTGRFGSDPKVVNCRIYWNLRADWVEVPVDLSQSNQLYKIIELPENSYSFEIMTYDKLGNSSIPVTATGSSYGDSYKSSLSNRLINSAKEEEADDGTVNAVIEWRAIDTSRGVYASEVTYTDTDGISHTVSVPVTETTTTLPRYKSGTDITHISLYKPTTDCLDIFYSPSTTYVAVAPEAELKELDKTMFSVLTLPGDATPAAGVLGLEKIWDGITQEDWTQRFVSNGTDPATPQWVTVDTGQTVKLTSLKLWNYGDDGTTPGVRLHYAPIHMQHFQIWGSREPKADGSWDSWTLLGDFIVTKPSGSPVGVETEEDRAKGVAGFDFEFTGEQPKVRYIRIKNLGNWDGQTYTFDIEEISLTGWVY